VNIIEIDGFTKVYKKKVKAVDELTLNIPQGSFFGLLGPNGAGKTTTVNYIAGLIRPTSGKLKIFNEEITENSYLHKAKMGFVLEQPLYIEKFTGYEYINFAGQMYGLDKKKSKSRSEELLNFMGLYEKRDETIESYSAGMKKKISLSAALIHNPSILILDEPFEGIDPVSSVNIREILVQMVHNNVTIILTSHVLDIVEKLCDEFAIIDKGKLVFQGRIADIHNTGKTQDGNENYKNLEDLFCTLVGKPAEKNTLSWLTDH